MASQKVDYVHKTVILQCCINSNELKKDTSNIRLISTDDWDKKLKSILLKISKKFKFIANMDDSSWILTINDEIIDKQNSVKLSELLSSIPPVAVIKIEEQRIIIIIHYNDKIFHYKLKSNIDEWNNNTYLDLIQSVRKHFNLGLEFDLFEDLKGDNDEIVDIDDIDDIIDAIQGQDDGENDDDSKDSQQLSAYKKSLHLYIKEQQKQYASTNNDDEMNGNISNQNIINEIKAENISIKASINDLSKELNDIKQRQQYHRSNDDNKEEAIISNKERIIGECNKCNGNIRYFENELFNITLINNKWQHIDCEYKPKVSNLNNIDVWSKIRYGMIQANERKASLDISHIVSGWHNIFGVMTVKHGDSIRKWKIRINKLLNNNFYIGIINAAKVQQSLRGAAYQNGIVLNPNGYIYCFKKNYQSHFVCKQGDIVSIILDIQNNILLFKINDIDINVPVNDLNINLKTIKWKLFASLYNPGDEIVILDNDNNYNEDDGKDENKEDEVNQIAIECNKCNKSVTKRDHQIYNIEWSSKSSWCHADCKLSAYKIPHLDVLSAKDEFNKVSAYKALVTLSDDAHTFTTNKQSVYQTVFGVMSIKNGTKEWNIRINNGSSNMYVGIVESDKIVQVALNSIPASNIGAYYMNHNGLINGNGLSVQSNMTYKKGDIVSVILDLDKHTLGFGTNNKYALVNGANVKDKAYTLFVSMYAINNGVTIINGIDEEKKPFKGKPLYNCGSCGKGIHEMDFDINNANYDAKQWHHIDCNFEIPNLSQNDRDQWDRMTSNNTRFSINKYEATLISIGSGGYSNVFGCITIKENTKQWNVKIDKLSSDVYIGVVDSTKLHGKQSGIPGDSYYLGNDGYIRGSSLSINTGVGFATGDIINVILDIEKGILSFGKNGGNFVHAKDANIKKRSFNLFCCVYRSAGTKVTIQS